MQWLHSTRRGGRYLSGHAPWISAGSPGFASWRWPEHPSGGLLIQMCPLEEFCVARETIHPVPMTNPSHRAEDAGSQIAPNYFRPDDGG